MIIPKKVTVGFTTYAVHQPDTLSFCRAGFVNYSTQNIYVAQKAKHTKHTYTPKERFDTFWHELTHAILNDMQHPLRNSEAFVTAFSKRLSKAIRTAEL